MSSIANQQVFLGLSTLLAWISFALSTAFVLTARNEISSRGAEINGVQVSTRIGATMPLVLVAAVSLCPGDKAMSWMIVRMS
jgi:hypothetical protein